MMGTTFSVTEAIRLTPPIKMTPAITARTAPVTHVGIWKAFWKASEIELA